MDEKWAGVWMSVQQGKWRVLSRSSSQGPIAGSQGGDRGRWAREKSPPMCGDLPSWVSAPECTVSAEKKRASPAVRQEKGNLLGGKERMTGSQREPVSSFSDGVLLIPHQ